MNSEILIYQNPDGNINIDVRLENETVWLTQEQMQNLFGKSKATISEHIKNVFKEGKQHRNRRRVKKEKPDVDSLIESDEHFGFIAGYTSSGVPYGLTHEEWDEIYTETKKEEIKTISD